MQARSLGQDVPLEKAIATHTRILAWKIPWTEEPGGLQSMGSRRVGHDRITDHARTRSSLPLIPTLAFHVSGPQVLKDFFGQTALPLPSHHLPSMFLLNCGLLCTWYIGLLNNPRNRVPSLGG